LRLLVQKSQTLAPYSPHVVLNIASERKFINKGATLAMRSLKPEYRVIKQQTLLKDKLNFSIKIK
jgi:hypothetical protein